MDVRKLAKWCVSLGVLALSLSCLDWSSLKLALQRITPWSLVFCLLLCVAHFCVAALRWVLIATPNVPCPAVKHVRAYLYSNLFNSLTPANIGGDVYRVFALKGVAGSMPVVLSIVRERVIGLVGYLLYYVLAWASALPGSLDGPQMFSWAAAGSAAALAGIALALRFLPSLPRILPTQGRVAGLLASVATAFGQADRRNLWPIIGLTLLSTWLWVAAAKVVAAGLGLELPWTVLGMVAVLVELIRFIPATIQGIGVREGSYAFLVALAGYSAEPGFILGAIVYLVLGAALLLTGAAGALLPQGRPAEPEG